MFQRLLLFLFLLVVFSLACSRFSNLPPESDAAQSAGSPENTLIPPSFPTSQAIEPTLPAPISTTEVPATTQPPAPEIELPALEEGVDPDELLYTLQPGTPRAMQNIYYPELGCNWMGVGGQVFGEGGQPVGMLIIEVGGELEGNEVRALTLTGSASQWGPGGYEFQLAEKPALSSGAIWLQVLDLEGLPLSNKVYFDTFDQCEQAAILVNFTHISALAVNRTIYLPVIRQASEG